MGIKDKILVLLLVLTACQVPSSNTELTTMHDAVMAVHDEVMPKMRDINRAKKELRTLELPSKDENIQQLIIELDEADEAMMAWMAQFKKPDYSDVASAKAYYQDQMKRIESVKTKMLNAIQGAEQYSKAIK